MTANRLLALALGVAGVVGIATASQAPWRAHPSPDGAVRLSLSARPERIEQCRTLTEEELAARPAHMRQPVVCEGTSARYRLVLAAGEAVLLDTALTGGGARRDRPLHLLEEFPLPPGTHRLAVTLHRVDTIPPDATVEATPARSAEVLPAELGLETTVTIAARRVVLVTYDPRRQRLVALTAPRTP